MPLDLSIERLRGASVIEKLHLVLASSMPALPTAYVSELDDRTTRLGRATSYNMHGDGWSTCRRTPMEGEPMHGLDVESIFRGTGITSTTCVHDTRVVRTHANGLMGSG